MKDTRYLFSERVYEKIKADINSGRLYPGERVLEARLAQELNCSHAPVREGLRQLANEGVLLFERNKGCSVRKLSIGEIDETYTVLSLLEGYAVRMTVEQPKDEDLAYLKDLDSKMVIAAEAANFPAWISINDDFHKHFIIRSGNQTLAELFSRLKFRIYPYRRITIGMPHYFPKHLDFHKHIIDAYQSGNAGKGEKLMRRHLETARDELVSFLRKQHKYAENGSGS